MTRIVFDVMVAADHPSLPGHFPGRPVVPGVLVLDQVFQGLLRASGQEVAHLRQARFTSPLLPGELANATCEIEGPKASFRVTAQREDVAVAIADGMCQLASPRKTGVVT